MNDSLKTGPEVLESFFKNLDSVSGVDSAIARLLKELFEGGKLTEKNVLNALQKEREAGNDPA
jgi:hypothetical protein